MYCFLLGDDNVSVVKRCIRALLGVLQRTLAIAASSANHLDKDGQDLWKTVENAVKRVESFVKDGKVSTGVKLSASKFLEQGILLATADKVPCTPPLLEVAGELPMKDSIVTKQDALKLGNGMLMALISLLKDIKQSETHGPLAIACIRSASQMHQAKPQFAGELENRCASNLAQFVQWRCICTFATGLGRHPSKGFERPCVGRFAYACWRRQCPYQFAGQQR